MNLFNEFHSRDTSKKVRTVKKAYAEQGKFLACIPPLGYMRSKDDHNALEIDESTAPVARRIFEMRANGMGFRTIAIALNEDKIPPPRDIHYAKLGKPNPNRCTHFGATTPSSRLSAMKSISAI